MSDLRLAYVTQWFPPEPVAAPIWIAQALRRQGWDVRVLTGLPNYPDGIVHEGYRTWRTRRDEVDGLDVIRAPLYASHDSSALRRMANYVSWALRSSSVRRSPLASADATLVYSSPATAALPAMVARRRFGTPYILLVQDVWPDSIFASGFLKGGRVRSLAERLVGRFAEAAYRGAHAIAVISPGMKDLLVERGVPAEKVHVVFNWADEAVFRPGPADPGFRDSLGVADDDFLVMYAGAQGPAQDLDTVIDAAIALRDHHRVHIALVGAGVSRDALRERARVEGLSRVHFVDPVPLGDMPSILPCGDAHLVSLANHDLFKITLPSKTQSLMAAGQPIIVSAPGDAARVVLEARAGIAVPPSDGAALAAAILEMSKMNRTERAALGEAGLAAYQRDMSEAVGAGRLSDLLRAAVESREA